MQEISKSAWDLMYGETEVAQQIDQKARIPLLFAGLAQIMSLAFVYRGTLERRGGGGGGMRRRSYRASSK